MNKNYFFLIILIFFTFEVNSSEKKVFIKKTVNEHIITNVDINNEINFITTLNPNLANVDKKKINKYAEINLVNEKIKISELSKFYEIKMKDYSFKHGKGYTLPNGNRLYGCYHPSPRNVNTGKLDFEMMTKLFSKIS